MNSYTLTSVKGTYAYVEFSIEGRKVTERFDARYIPLSSKDELDEYCKKWMDSYTFPDQVEVAISDEVDSIIGEKQEIENSPEEEVPVE